MNDKKGFWFVMDGRARFDTDRAVILEALCEGTRHNVPRKAAGREWKNHDATLCFAPQGDDGVYGPAEYVEDV